MRDNYNIKERRYQRRLALKSTPQLERLLDYANKNPFDNHWGGIKGANRKAMVIGELARRRMGI